MILSKKCLYAIIALIELALNRDNPNGTTIKKISQKRMLPEKFLRQLFLAMKQAGLVESVRGAGGGYRLKKDPIQISMLDVIEGIGGCIKPREIHKDPTATFILNTISKRMSEALNISLLQLIEEYTALSGEINYNI
jgi:Rrf2 family protein